MVCRRRRRIDGAVQVGGEREDDPRQGGSSRRAEGNPHDGHAPERISDRQRQEQKDELLLVEKLEESVQAFLDDRLEHFERRASDGLALFCGCRLCQHIAGAQADHLHGTWLGK